MLFLLVLMLVDIHTLLVLIFNEYLSPIYVFSGFSFAFIKGLYFFIIAKGIFNTLDMVFSLLMLLLLVTSLPTFLFWIIALYFVYKILMSFSAL